MGTSSVALLGALSFVVWIVIAAVAASVLGIAYSRTRMSSFLWLLGAVVVWPTIARLTSFVFSMAAARIAAGASLPMASVGAMFVGVSLVESLIGGILLIVALSILSQQCLARFGPPSNAQMPGFATPPYGGGPGSPYRG